VVYAAFAAYAHQLQHEKPELVFWLGRPVHHLHHRDNMWRDNFGISLDIWDRVFATYKAAEWRPDHPPNGYPLRRYVDIRWI
jgi:sterol desaturase/sphingolipid hydroxylase (fatty acid hydroxylase superfamily)